MRFRDLSPTLKVMPRDQETDVPRDATLSVTAPRPVNHCWATSVKVRSLHREIEGILDISSDGRILFWRPTEILEAQAQHHVLVSGMRDERGTLFDDLASTFFTGVYSYVDLLLSAD